MPVTIPFTLEVITPVSIGNGQDLKVLDYILDTAKQKVYILSQRKWLQYLYSIDKLFEYEQYIENYTKGQKETIYEWMERTIGTPDDTVLSNVSKRQLRCVKSSISKKTLNHVHLCMTALNGMPYIPGSSLKGVIISAVIAYIVENDKEENDKVFRREWRNKLIAASNNDSELRRCTGEYEEALDTLILSCIKKSTGEDVIDGVKKLFHSISVSDIILSNNDSMATYILPRYDSVAGTKKIKSLPIYRECIIPSTKLKGTLSVNLHELKNIGINSMSDLIKIIEEHTQRLLRRWKFAFEGDIEESCIQELEQATCLMGSSIGFLHKTLLSPLFDYQEDADNSEKGNKEEVNVVKSILSFQRQAKDHRHNEDEIISPRTLKLTKYEGKYYIFGGVKLHLENN